MFWTILQLTLRLQVNCIERRINVELSTVVDLDARSIPKECAANPRRVKFICLAIRSMLLNQETLGMYFILIQATEPRLTGYIFRKPIFVLAKASSKRPH